jgi:hypothetical protein
LSQTIVQIHSTGKTSRKTHNPPSPGPPIKTALVKNRMNRPETNTIPYPKDARGPLSLPKKKQFCDDRTRGIQIPKEGEKRRKKS